MPELTNVIVKIFFSIQHMLTFINTYILPFVSKKRLNEQPITWLTNRLDTVLEQRKQMPTSRVDVLQLMMQAMTEEKIDVSTILIFENILFVFYKITIKHMLNTDINLFRIKRKIAAK